MLSRERLGAGFHLLEKPYTRAQMVGRIREILDTPARNAAGTGCALIVEDEPLLREIVAYVLKTHGFSVVEAGSLAQTKALTGTQFDLAIVDQNLGDGFGAEVVKALRETAPGLPVIFASGDSSPDPQVAEWQTQRAPTVALRKPYTLAGLTEAIESLQLEPVKVAP
jgi:DNA-binding response OmpR family regulator